MKAEFPPIRGRTLLERFEEKYIPEPNSGCWLWLGALTKGYGVINTGKGYDGRRTKEAYTVAYELYIGPVPEGLELDHKCKVKCCVNPYHVEPVTHQVNMIRGEAGKKTGARNRAKTHCRNGHPFDEENTYIDSRGDRACKTCKREHSKNKYRTANPEFGTWNQNKTHCVHGHPFSEENTYRYNGKRICRACLSERRKGVKCVLESAT